MEWSLEDFGRRLLIFVEIFRRDDLQRGDFRTSRKEKNEEVKLRLN